jgi:two-component system sensor kinase FixL
VRKIWHVRGLAKKQQIDIDPFDVNDLIVALLWLVAPVARRRNVTMSASFGDLPHVTGDRVYVQQILLNLLLNAMDALAEAPDDRRHAASHCP